MNIIDYTCIYCKSEDSIKLYPTYDLSLNKYHIHRCNKCSAYFLVPKPGRDELIEAYDSSYYGANIEKFSMIIEFFLDKYRNIRANFVRKYLPEKGKILDIGCGNGKFLQSLLRFGDFQLYGNEIDGKSAYRASRIPRINLTIGPLQDNHFENGGFDVITLFHVFEHLTNPKEVLDIISKILKKDGHLILSFPNIDSFQSRVFKGKWFHLDSPRHLFFFKPKTFIKLMNDNGYILIKQNFISLEQNPYGMFQSIMNVFFKKREVLFERLKANKSYATEFSYPNILFQKYLFIFSFVIFVAGDLIMCLFKKNATVRFVFKKVI
jgi:SAM-dependent methyltransferase